MPKTLPFKLGADPEFNIIHLNKKILASRFINLLYKSNNHNTNFGTIGCDGHMATGELRPKPSNDVIELTQNIKELLLTLYKKLQFFDLSTLSIYGSVGGHIHFDAPKNVPGTCFHESLSESLKQIQRFMALFYLPVMLGENSLNLKIRNHSYGDITDWRDGNGERTYEFRTPSAEWLTTPEITQSTLAYFGTVYNEINVNPKIHKALELFLYTSTEQAKNIQELTLSNYPAFNSFLLQKLTPIIRACKLYPQFKEEIETILDYKKVQKLKQKAHYNINEGWKLTSHETLSVPPKISKARQIIYNALGKNYIHLIHLSEFNTISYNIDKAVAIFANRLFTVVAAYNWKLKNRYYLFGLRKSIPGFVVAKFYSPNSSYLAPNENLILSPKILQDENETIVDTEKVAQIIRSITTKMQQKFLEDELDSIKIEQNFAGNPTLNLDNHFLIGIPLSFRTTPNPKTSALIKLVYLIENNLPLTAYEYTPKPEAS